MSAPGKVGMVLDRALTVELLDVALRIATQHAHDAEVRQLLGIALGDYVTPQEAQNKTKKILTRVWIAPPPEARPMIDWAIAHQDEIPDRRALHYGALLATFPFFGNVAGMVGRQIGMEGAADRAWVRSRARTTFGDRASIDAGAAKSLRTLRLLNLINGPTNGPFLVDRVATAPAASTMWFLHALMLTRQTTAIGFGELSRAPELAFIKLDPSPSKYPLLELHTENGRTVAVTSSYHALKSSR